MFRVTTIRDHATRAGRVISASSRTLPGPLAFLIQGAMLAVLVGVAVVIAVPVLVLGVIFMAAGMLLAAARGALGAVRLGTRDEGRRNVRVIERAERPDA